MMWLATGTFTGAYAAADFFGKMIFLGLFALSMLCWIVLLHKIWILRQVKKGSRQFIDSLIKRKDSILNVNLDALPKMIHKELPHPYSCIFSTMKEKTRELLDKNNFFINREQSDHPIYLSGNDVELIETHLHASMIKQKERLEKNLFILSTIKTLAPFLGLLGTVWGILVTFSELQSKASVVSNNAMLGGLSTALVTTVLGLVIAIPALVGSNYLRNAIRSYFSEMEEFAHHLLSTIELQYRKVDVT
ncbi:MAG: MotA/TolQ/ExbB proton channel family protein [Simkaniaceae bacterium]|nr:MotA/TolQ/ExbB proton channel family protein [Simkaniaceae bacterium]